MNDKVYVKEETVVRIDIIWWDEPDWKDGRPHVVLSPVIQYHDSKILENIIEDICIDGCVYGHIKESARQVIYNLPTLIRAFHRARKSGSKKYSTKRVYIKYFLDEHKELDGEIINNE